MWCSVALGLVLPLYFLPWMGHDFLFLWSAYDLLWKTGHWKKQTSLPVFEYPLSVPEQRLAGCSLNLGISLRWKLKIFWGLFWAYVLPGPASGFQNSSLCTAALEHLNFQDGLTSGCPQGLRWSIACLHLWSLAPSIPSLLAAFTCGGWHLTPELEETQTSPSGSRLIG